MKHDIECFVCGEDDYDKAGGGFIRKGAGVKNWVCFNCDEAGVGIPIDQLPGLPVVKLWWYCACDECNHKSALYDYGLWPLVYWPRRKQWLDVYNRWMGCGKHFKMLVAKEDRDELYSVMTCTLPPRSNIIK